jgi:hypothetical protein
LRDVFGVFTVLRYMLRYPEDLAFVLPDQLLIGCCITFPGARNQRYVWVDLFRSWGLDGGHWQKGALIGLSLMRSAFQYLTLQP